MLHSFFQKIEEATHSNSSYEANFKTKIREGSRKWNYESILLMNIDTKSSTKYKHIDSSNI